MPPSLLKRELNHLFAYHTNSPGESAQTQKAGKLHTALDPLSEK